MNGGNSLLDTALSHHDEGRRIISVKADKKPYLKGWDDYFERPQTEEELRQQFSNGAHGLALILYPGCPFGVLDHDGRTPKKHGRQPGSSYPRPREISPAAVTIIYFSGCLPIHRPGSGAAFGWLKPRAIVKTTKASRNLAAWIFWSMATS